MVTASPTFSAKAPRPDPRMTPMVGTRDVRARIKAAAAEACSNKEMSLFTSNYVLSHQDAHNRGGHQIGHGSGQHSTQSKPRQVVAAVGCQGADAPDLNADGTQISKTA